MISLPNESQQTTKMLAHRFKEHHILLDKADIGRFMEENFQLFLLWSTFFHCFQPFCIGATIHKYREIDILLYGEFFLQVGLASLPYFNLL